MTKRTYTKLIFYQDQCSKCSKKRWYNCSYQWWNWHVTDIMY